MSTSEPIAAHPLPWGERAADLLNAILVKEARQSLKSRQFVLTFLTLLLAAWSVSAFGLAFSGAEAEYGTLGRWFFFAFYIVLAVATLLIVPFGAYRSLLAERDLNTYELLSITTLTPGKIVWGKLGSAMLQLFIFYSAITPFIAFASLLNGFDVPTAAYVLAASMFASLLLSMAALMFATLGKQRMWQGFNSLIVFGGLGIVLIFAMTIVGGDAAFHGMSFDNAEFWWATGLLVVAGISYFVLMHQITIAQLTFESDNRTSGIRLAANAQFLLLWGCLLAFGLYERFAHGFGGTSDGELIAFCTISAIHLSVFGLFAVTEPEVLSRRISRDLPRNRILRLAYVPFLPGGSRGFLWLLANVSVLWFMTVICQGALSSPPRYGIAAGAWTPSLAVEQVASEFARILNSKPSTWSLGIQFSTAFCCYVLIYLGAGCAAGRVLRRFLPDLSAAHLRVLTFLGLAGGMLLPLLIYFYRRLPQESSVVDVTSPVIILPRIGNGNVDNYVIGTLMLVAFLVVLSNVRGMWRGIAEVMSPRPLVTSSADGAAVDEEVVLELSEG